jgi:hypothetical protein
MRFPVTFVMRSHAGETIHSLETYSGHHMLSVYPCLKGGFSGRALGRTDNHPTQGLTTASS